MLRRCGLLILVGLLAAGCGDAPEKEKLEKTERGVEYRDITVGDGKEAQPGDRVRVHYTGWLKENGRKFDSSRDGFGQEPFEFMIGEGRVIQGWDEGVPGMKVGGKRKLVIPSRLAYGLSGQGDIPPSADLIFEVELVEVLK